MRTRPGLAAAAVALALCCPAAAAQSVDPAARALLERQQQSDAFSLQLQQWLERQRAGNLPLRERLELESLHQDQRLRQGGTFYRQQIQQQQTQQSTGIDGGLRDAEMMRFEQDRQQELSRLRWEAERVRPADQSVAQPPQAVKPGIATAPVPRGERKPAPPAADAGP